MIKKIILLIFIIFVIFSCYTHKIILNADRNSGQMIIEYTMDDDYFQLISMACLNFQSENNEQFDPTILIDEELFKKSFKNNNLLKLKSVNITMTDNGDQAVYNGKIVIDFYDLNRLLNIMPKQMVNLSVKKQNNLTTLTQTIDYNKLDPDGVFKDFVMQQKEDDINLYNKLMQKTKFKFIVNSALPLKYTEGVVVSSDKKTAEYTFKINDIISGKILKFIISF